MLVRDAIVFSGFSWESFNVPERIALALSRLGCRVLHCASPVSIFRSPSRPIHEVGAGIYSLQARFLSSRLCDLPGAALVQAHMLRRQIDAAARGLGLHKPLFIYAWLGRLFPLCLLMRRDHFMVHICMDHSVSVDLNYDRYLDVSDKTLAIPKSCYHKFRARYGEKVAAIPQSGNVREISTGDLDNAVPAALCGVPRPRLGYFGPINRRVNTPLVADLLRSHPEWHFISCGSEVPLSLPNAHCIPWQSPRETARSVQNLDVGFMPYNLHDEEALHCIPLKLFDYFAFGLPVVSTPVIHLWEYRDLVYLGDSVAELEAAVRAALSEPLDSPKRAARTQIARSHSIETLASTLRRCLPLDGDFAFGSSQNE